jgi:hypothetical protein
MLVKFIYRGIIQKMLFILSSIDIDFYFSLDKEIGSLFFIIYFEDEKNIILQKF